MVPSVTLHIGSFEETQQDWYKFHIDINTFFLRLQSCQNKYVNMMTILKKMYIFQYFIGHESCPLARMLTLQISVFLLTFWQECWHLDIYAFHNLARMLTLWCSRFQKIDFHRLFRRPSACLTVLSPLFSSSCTHPCYVITQCHIAISFI